MFKKMFEQPRSSKEDETNQMINLIVEGLGISEKEKEISRDKLLEIKKTAVLIILAINRLPHVNKDVIIKRQDVVNAIFEVMREQKLNEMAKKDVGRIKDSLEATAVDPSTEIPEDLMKLSGEIWKKDV